MGGNNSKKAQLAIKEDEWEKISQTPYYDLMKNKNTQALGELHHFVVPEDKETKEQLQKYFLRLNPNSHQVQVKGVNVQDSGFGFCGNRKMAKVMTERIPTRFADSKLLSREEEASVLYNALVGFDKLHQDNGMMDINSRMFGYSEKGQVKVWLNENYGMNYPSQFKVKNPEELKDRQENMMIQNIVELVDEKCENRRVNEPLRSKLMESPNFANAIGNLPYYSGIPLDHLAQNFVYSQPNILYNHQPVETLNSGHFQSSYQQPVQSQPPQLQQANYNSSVNYSVSNPVVNQSGFQSVNQPVMNQSISNQPVVLNKPVANQSIAFNQPVIHRTDSRKDTMTYQSRAQNMYQPPPVNMSQGPNLINSSKKFSFSYQGQRNSQY